VTTPNEPTIAEQVTKLYEVIAGYHTTHMLEIGRELGMWEYLVSRPGATSAAAAGALRLDPFYTDVLCRTAFSAGLVDREGEGWAMAPHMDTLLGSPGATFDLSHAARAHMAVGQDYPSYVDRFRSGSASSYQDHDQAFMEVVAAALQSLPRIFTEAVLPQLPALDEQLERADRFLDVGCGAGWAVVTLAERYPRAEVIGVEIEETSAAMATRLIEERDMTDRCRIVHGDASQFSSNDEFDVATLFLVYHEIAPELKRKVLRSIHRVLRDGGTLLLFDEVMPTDDEGLRSMPSRFGALAQWYELTWGNVISTRDEVIDDCLAAGFEITDELPFSRFHILVATKGA